MVGKAADAAGATVSSTPMAAATTNRFRTMGSPYLPPSGKSGNQTSPVGRLQATAAPAALLTCIAVVL